MQRFRFVLAGVCVAVFQREARAQTPAPPAPPPAATTPGPAPATAPAPETASAGTGLTLEAAIKLALTYNERARKAPLRVDVASGQLEKSRAAFLPTISASGQGTLHGTADKAGRILAGTGSVQVNQPLLNASAFPLYASASHTLESERWGAQQDRRTLEYDTAHAFLLALTNERLLKAAKQRVDRAQASLQDSDARASAGLASTNDVTRAAMEVASAQAQVAGAQGNLERANIALTYLMGRPVAAPLVVPTRTTNAAQRGHYDMVQVLRAAESRRADVRSSHERTEALEASADEPLWRLVPTVGVSGVERLTVDPEPAAEAHDESALLTLTWTLYDGGARYADKKTRRAQAESQALDESALRRSIATDVATAIAALRAARATYSVDEQALSEAQKNVDETAILYRQGLARAIEVTTANSSLYDAQVALESAQLTMEQAYLQLRQALGYDPVGGDVAGATTPSSAGAQ